MVIALAQRKQAEAEAESQPEEASGTEPDTEGAEAAPAEDLIQLDICAVLCLCGQKNIDKASGHERI